MRAGPADQPFGKETASLTAPASVRGCWIARPCQLADSGGPEADATGTAASMAIVVIKEAIENMPNRPVALCEVCARRRGGAKLMPGKYP
jgi:hypothetical protein